MDTTEQEKGGLKKKPECDKEKKQFKSNNRTFESSDR